MVVGTFSYFRTNPYMGADSPPDHIDSLYEDLEEATEATSVLQRLSHSEAGWLARYIRDQISRDREKAGDEFEKELVVGHQSANLLSTCF
jgi:hypothetical protein